MKQPWKRVCLHSPIWTWTRSQCGKSKNFEKTLRSLWAVFVDFFILAKGAFTVGQCGIMLYVPFSYGKLFRIMVVILCLSIKRKKNGANLVLACIIGGSTFMHFTLFCIY